MMMIRKNKIGLTFCSDDEPVELDCGHTAYPGEDYCVISFDAADKDGKITQIKRTTCFNGKEKCDCDVCFEVLRKNYMVMMKDVSVAHVNTAEDEWKAYQDYLADRK